VPAKIIKLVGLKNGGRLSPINLVTFAGTQNGEFGTLNLNLIFQTNIHGENTSRGEDISKQTEFYINFRMYSVIRTNSN
jgi:hypothetical protein